MEAVSPGLSIVLLVADRYACVRAAVRNLARQTGDAALELVLVARSREELELTEPDLADLRRFAAWQVVEVGRIETSGAARTAGIRAARAPIVVIAEDHSFPGPGWAAALLAAFEDGWSAVGPVIENANPGTIVSWANAFAHYGPWLHPAPGGARSHIAGHNSAYRRDVLLALGDELPILMEAETVLHWKLGAMGHRLATEPRARVGHTNMTVVGESIREAFHWGRMFAVNRVRGWPASRRLRLLVTSPAIAPIRFWRNLGDARRVGLVGRFLLASPMIAVIFVVDSIGQAAGYALPKSGRTPMYLTDREFHRERFTKEIIAS
jgi:Glycosyl transferase family 2